MVDTVRKTFHVVDYVVFSIAMVVSVAIGIVVAYKDKDKKEIKNFLLAGRKMSVLPVSLSLLSSFVSAITILGTPSEMYVFGTMYLWFGITYFTSLVLAAHLYIPVFYKMGITSAYEYLEQRFNKLMRTLCSVGYCLETILLMAIVLYAPALALNAVTDLDLWGTVCAVGVVSTLYTMIGGMKAVLWTDAFQVGVMYLGLIVLLIKGSMAVGGFAEAWNIAADRGRIQLTDFSFDPTIRHSFWAVTVGGTFASLGLYGTNQSQVQRSLTLPSLRKSKIAIWLNLPLKFIMVNLCAMIGIVMFAFYKDCDPLEANLVKAKDQLVPLFVMDILGTVPGLPGLFVAVLFCGALSTISSGLNSMTAAIIQDIVRPFIRPNITERKALILAKIIAAVLGACSIVLSYGASVLDGVLQAAITLNGVIGGTVLGVFTLGMVFPWANSYGAFFGLLSSISFLAWISVGVRIVKPPIRRPPLPVSVSACFVDNPLINNLTASINATTATTTSQVMGNVTSVIGRASTALDELYSISYMYYALIAVLIVCIVGMVVSLITGPTKPSSLDPKLMSPVFDIYLPCLPEKIRHKLRFGVRYDLLSHVGKSINDLSEERTRLQLHEVHLSSGPTTSVATCRTKSS